MRGALILETDLELRDWLTTKKRTMEWLAGKIGIYQSVVSRICNYKHYPSVDTIQKIVVITNGDVTANELCKIPKRYWR